MRGRMVDNMRPCSPKPDAAAAYGDHTGRLGEFCFYGKDNYELYELIALYMWLLLDLVPDFVDDGLDQVGESQDEREDEENSVHGPR